MNGLEKKIRYSSCTIGAVVSSGEVLGLEFRHVAVGDLGERHMASLATDMK
jgi:hypothetical protein